MLERIDTLFKQNEPGRIKEILHKKYNLFQKDHRSSSMSRSKNSKSKSSERNFETSPLSLKPTLKRSNNFFDQSREKSVSFN